MRRVVTPLLAAAAIAAGVQAQHARPAPTGPAAPFDGRYTVRLDLARNGTPFAHPAFVAHPGQTASGSVAAQYRWSAKQELVAPDEDHPSARLSLAMAVDIWGSGAWQPGFEDGSLLLHDGGPASRATVGGITITARLEPVTTPK